MIATTYNCGCPIPQKPSLIAKPVGLQEPCSPCCFHPFGLSYQLQRHTAQCSYMQSRTVEKPKRIVSRDKVLSCCIDCKNSRYAPSYPQRIPSKSSIFLQRSNFCCAINVSRTSPRRLISATTCTSKDSVSKQFPKSRSESRLKKKLETSNMEQTPTDKVVSEIVRKGQPYKEIEAVVNDNRVIIRMHKESVNAEYDPPCECVGQATVKESASSLKKCDDGVVFDMAKGSLELCRTSREDTSSMKKICDQEETGCRTLTLYPNVKDNDDVRRISGASESEKVRKSKVERLIDLEENPNIFVLRIRKRCNSSDKKQKIDLEFRAPRPWLPRNDKKKKLDKNEDKVEESDIDEQTDIDIRAEEC